MPSKICLYIRKSTVDFFIVWYDPYMETIQLISTKNKLAVFYMAGSSELHFISTNKTEYSFYKSKCSSHCFYIEIAQW